MGESVRWRRWAWLAGLVMVAAAARGEDWPQWRGPNLNGSSGETSLAASFSLTDNVAWKAAMPGVCGSTPIVVGGRVYLISPAGRAADLLGLCLDAKDGRVLWTKKLSAGRLPPTGEIAACSPASDGKAVYFLFGTGDLAAVDAEGKVLWSRGLAKDYGPFANRYGYSASPLVYKGRLYVPLLRCDRPYPYTPGAGQASEGELDSCLLCLDAATGRTLWRHVRPTDASKEARESYVTPLPVAIGGRTEIVISGGEYATAHDSETGKELWRWAYTKRSDFWQRMVVSPVFGEGLVFVSQPKSLGIFALQPGRKGSFTTDQVVWKHYRPSPDVCTPLMYGGRLYVLACDQKVLCCLEPKSGAVKWQHRLGGAGPYRASPTGADGRIYCISEGGEVVILAAGDEPKELFRTSLDVRPCRSTIVAAAGSLFVRLPRELLCVRK